MIYKTLFQPEDVLDLNTFLYRVRMVTCEHYLKKEPEIRYVIEKLSDESVLSLHENFLVNVLEAKKVNLKA